MSVPRGWARGLRDLTRPWERRAKRRVIETVGGRMRARVIALLALVLALSSADNAAVGADAGPLKDALHLNFTEIGLLVALPALAGAIATVPIGALTDRLRRVSLLKASIIVWSLSMVAAGAANSFETLLVSRLALGAVIGTVGPTLASLIGDFFASSERAKVYGFILTGELIGSVLGLFVSGNAAVISWRLAFWVLAIPSALLAWAIGRYLPEPAHGGAGRLAASVSSAPGRRPVPTPDTADPARDDSTSELQRALEQAGVQPRAENVLSPDRHRMMLWDAVRYVLSVPTNVALIIASSLGYFFIAGILTFGVVFVRHQYSVGQSVATSLLAVLSIAAVGGVLVSGRLADALLRRGRVSSRVVVAAGSFLAAGALFLPPLLIHSLEIGLPLLWLAGAALYGSNPPLDAARLDIMPHWLWGRAEGVRTLLRSVFTAIAPLLFGLLSDLLGAGGGSTHATGQAANVGGVSYAFMIMLIPLVVGGVILLRARHDYPRDVATAIASESAWSAHDPGLPPSEVASAD